MKSPRLNHALSLCCVFAAVAANAQSPQAAKSKQPVAVVDGQSISEDDLNTAAQGQLMQLHTQEYEIKRKALDGLIEQKLLEDAARKQGVTTEQLLAKEVDAKVTDPSDAEVEGYYLALRERINKPLSDVKPQILTAIRQSKMQQARQEYMKTLRTPSNVSVLMSAPRVDVPFDPTRLRGNPKAPVMIVEFSDYQCPYCRQAEPTVEAILAKYGDKVSLSYRDFPLRSIHDHAEIAAEASRCALEQGRFWDYHDQLFKSASLEKEALIGYAKEAKLDDKRFESCLTSERYKAQIDKDLDEGRRVGVTGTPAFFINGIELSGAQGQDNFIRAIDDELSKKPQVTALGTSDKQKTVTVSISQAPRN